MTAREKTVAMASLTARVAANLSTSSQVKIWYSRRTTQTLIATLSSMTVVKNDRSVMPKVVVEIVKIANINAVEDLESSCQELDFVSVMMLNH